MGGYVACPLPTLPFGNDKMDKKWRYCVDGVGFTSWRAVLIFIQFDNNEATAGKLYVAHTIFIVQHITAWDVGRCRMRKIVIR